MIKKYFFIPASNQKFISKLDKIGADFIVFDLEDAIQESTLSNAINNLSQIEYNPNYLVRFPFTIADKKQIDDLLSIGFKYYIIPKIRSAKQFQELLRTVNFKIQTKFIVLIENPELLINLNSFVLKFRKHLLGIGLGSHDYADELNMQHDFENLYFARMMLLNVAKAYGIHAIDIASMEIVDEKKLYKEFISAVRMGYDSKFFIHPRQLEIFNKTDFYTQEEVEEAKSVLSQIKNEDYAAFKMQGKAFEKPHFNRLKKIINWAKKNERI